jgi:endonuclease/exonuclease/phosphatase family metal-dependent hydrolase
MRVMTWNLWWRFGPFEQRQQAIVDVIRSVDPDILCLQEVWSDANDDQSEQLAEVLGMHSTRTDPVFYDGQSFGNAILTRWPVDRIASQALPSASGEPGHRCIVAGVVDTPSGRWPIASTHFDHRFDASATRQQQATRLLELGLIWRGVPDNSLPLIVGADVNTVADTDEIRMLTGRRVGVAGIVFSDVCEHVGAGNGYTWRAANPYSAESTGPNRRLDYLIVSWPRPKPVGNPIRAWNVGTEPVDIDGEAIWPSDHAAIVADFVTPI